MKNIEKYRDEILEPPYSDLCKNFIEPICIWGKEGSGRQDCQGNK